jgi:hypothetical protein
MARFASRLRRARTGLTLAAGTLGVIVALAMIAIPLASASATPRLLQLSSDPFTNSTSQHATEVEPDTFAFGSTIVAAVQVGRFFDGGSSDIGFATSTNGGKTWTHGFLPGVTVNSSPPGVYDRASDPSVAFDARDNVWLISYLGLHPNGNGAVVDVDVSRSTDGGLTWGAPVAINASGNFNDKNWTVCDNFATSPFYGHCYTEYDVPTFTDLEQMNTSTDGGLTWGVALSTANNAHGIGGQPLVQPSGKVIVPFNGFAGRAGSLDVFTSSDGGASWGNASIVTLHEFAPIPGGIRAGTLPSAEIDAAGTVYVAYPDCRFEVKCATNDMVISTSSDGVSWAGPFRVPADAVGSGVDHFLPGLGVDRSTSGAGARLGLVYYFYPSSDCTAATCQLDVGFISSTNGGATWSASQQLAGPMSLAWLANTNQGRMVGDYFSTSFVGSPAFPALVSANAPSGGVFAEALFTVAGGISVTGGHGSSQGDVVVVSPNNTPIYVAPTTDQ